MPVLFMCYVIIYVQGYVTPIHHDITVQLTSSMLISSRFASTLGDNERWPSSFAKNVVPPNLTHLLCITSGWSDLIYWYIQLSFWWRHFSSHTLSTAPLPPLLTGLPACPVTFLQVIQNASACLVFNQPKCTCSCLHLSLSLLAPDRHLHQVQVLGAGYLSC